MSFLLRAVLMIGVLSYFALRQEAPARVETSTKREAADLTAALAGLPAEMRVKATRAAEAEIVRRLSEVRASQDTLSASDRRPSWRGVEGR